MKTYLFQTCLLAVALLTPPAVAQAQDYTYETNNGAITITSYTGSGGAVTIPATINGLPVTSIGDGVFEFSGLTNVMIPASIIAIGNGAFDYCYQLTAITVATSNSAYSSLNGVLFDKNLTTLIVYPTGKGGSYTIPDSVTNIGGYAFYDATLTSVTIPGSVTSIGIGAFEECTGLTNVTIGNGVVTIGDFAFDSCYSLGGVYFTGNAPVFGGSEFYLPTTLYYLPGTTGWDSVSYLSVLWNPQIQTNNASFGVHTNQFGFNVIWTNSQTVMVEACTNLSDPVWIAVGTVTFTDDWSYFSDPEWTNYPGRFYRLANFPRQPVWSGG